MERIIYLDNAATTFPKPSSVNNEVLNVLRHSCGNPGRSSHRIALSAANTVYECRSKIADFFGAQEDGVVFSLNATSSLNLAIKTTLKKGDHVLISDIEHNSVLRPVEALKEKGLISYDIYKSYPDSLRQLAEIRQKIRPNTAMITACHHSNICNLTLPISDIGKFCRKRGIIFLVDASQSAGILPINVEKDCIDLLCAPGHKGLYSPPGVGFTVFGSRFDTELPDTFIEGGNGIRSNERVMPDFLPERLESGTLPLPAIAGLSKGIDFVKKFPMKRLLEHEERLYGIMKRWLLSLNKIKIYSDTCGGILLFSVENIGSEALASHLNEYGICVRAGMHCAPLAHKKLGTPQNDGAVRVSFGAFNTERDVADFCTCLEKIIKKKR